MPRSILLATGFIAMLGASLALSRSATAAELVMFDSPSCVWCIRWDRDIGRTYDDTAEGRIAPLRKVPISGGIPSDLEITQPVTGTPTFVLVDAGREVGRIIGYPGRAAFWADLNALLDQLPDQKPGSVDAAPLTQTAF